MVLSTARRRMSEAVDRSTSVLIVGSSQDARAIAERLAASEHYEVVFGTERADLVAQADETVDARELRFDDGGLAALHLRVDAAVVATERDRTNLLVAQTLRARGEVGRLVVRVNDPDREELFAGLGAETVCPTDVLAPAFESALEAP